MSQYQKPQVYWPGDNRSQKHKTTSKMSHQIVHMAKYRGIVTPWRYNYVRHLRSRHLLTRLSIPRSVDLGFLILWLLRSHSYHSHAIKKTNEKEQHLDFMFPKIPKTPKRDENLPWSALGLKINRKSLRKSTIVCLNDFESIFEWFWA